MLQDEDQRPAANAAGLAEGQEKIPANTPGYRQGPNPADSTEEIRANLPEYVPEEPPTDSADLPASERE